MYGNKFKKPKENWMIFEKPNMLPKLTYEAAGNLNTPISRGHGGGKGGWQAMIKRNL